MGIYIGAIQIPFCHEFSVDNGSKKTQEIVHLSDIPPQIAEFRKGSPSLKVEGTLMSTSGDNKTADQYAEDVLALMGHQAPFNLIYDFQGKSGWAVVDSADSPETADNPLIRTCSVRGNFMPMSLYQNSYVTSPTIISNPWGFALGDADNNECWIPVPIGANVYGGDGSTITQSIKDGTQTLVQATTENRVRFDLFETDIDNGEVKVYDTMDDVESNWIRVFNSEHAFVGDPVIENGMYRLRLNDPTGKWSLYYWSGSAYTLIDSFDTGSYTHEWVTKITPEQVICKLDTGVQFTVERALPVLIEAGSTNIIGTNLSFSDQSTSSDNYLTIGTDLYVCGDDDFSITGSSVNLGSGNKWMIYAGSNVQRTAHLHLVNRRLKQELVRR